jgi:D-glycero-D-manno-heptose 1,7-bisphosphate phosphatase
LFPSLLSRMDWSDRILRDYPTQPKIGYGRAVFIDRDGTINVDTHYPNKLKDLILLPGVIEGMKLLAELPLDLIVVSNQAGIALKLYEQDRMTRFNRELRRRIEKHGARIDAFYFCPHLERKELPFGASGCACSKPSPGMFLEAAGDFGIDLTQSFVIGDRTSDIISGQLVRCRSVLVKAGACDREEGAATAAVEPDYTAENFYEAALVVKDCLEENQGGNRMDSQQREWWQEQSFLK